MTDSLKESMEKTSTKLTLAEARAKLTGQKGKKYWRSIDELAGTPEFEAAVRDEFPQHASEWIDPVSRRGFLTVHSVGRLPVHHQRVAGGPLERQEVGRGEVLPR